MYTIYVSKISTTAQPHISSPSQLFLVILSISASVLRYSLTPEERER